MRRLGRILVRAIAAFVVVVLALLAPVGYVELACHGPAADDPYQPILPPEARRNEAASYLTYPEWHIVHAYDDYAQVIAEGDPHDFGYWASIRGFWSSLCRLTEVADRHGGADGATRLTVYTIGVSFTAELALKALYEETVGRLATLLRGPERSPLDQASAEMARRYATFLLQVPWYKYDFPGDVTQLASANTGSLRDTERRIALGIEFGGKAAYAGVIADAVSAVGEADLTIRSVIGGIDPAALEAIDGVTVIGVVDQGVVIETPRYREFTHILDRIAQAGGEIVEIAGNDDILLTVISADEIEDARTIAVLPRQGYNDRRYLMSVKVGDLARTLRQLGPAGLRLEHIHDY